MDKEILEKGNKTKEGRLKILEIKELKAKNRVLNLIRFNGISLCFYIDLLAVTPFFTNLETKYPLFSILALIFATRVSRKVFGIKIEEDKQENIQEIIRLQNEILNEEDIERVK